MPQQNSTPSPHRFLAGHRRGKSPQKRATATPALLKQATKPSLPSRATPARRQHTSASRSSQFAPTPRFGIGRPGQAAHTQRSPSPSKPSPHFLRRPRGPADDLEDALVHDDDDEMLDDESAHAVPTTETDAAYDSNDPQWASDLAFSPKRRRLDHDINDYTPTAFDQPQDTSVRLSSAIPRFVSAQAGSTSATTQATTHPNSTGHHRPAFLRSSAVPQAPSEPLPETFSPHKRGHKFVPGGLAATVQQWVIETGQAAAQSRKGQGYLRNEDYVAKVHLDRVVGDGPFVAHGKETSMHAVDLLLAGRSNVDAEDAVINAGSVVGIRAPTWEVELDGRYWTVAVDWKML